LLARRRFASVVRRDQNVGVQLIGGACHEFTLLRLLDVRS
jgi:hypothetical protein